MEHDRYIPALRLGILTRVYDPLMERWTAAGQIRQAVIDALDLRPGLRLLELGCGPGRLAIAIKQQHPHMAIDALDADPEILAIARRNTAGAGVDVRFHQADVTRLPDLGTFDRIYTTLVFHHLLLADKEMALAEARRVLRPGGRFVIADFNRPRGLPQLALSYLIWPLDGRANTDPHRDGRYEQALRQAFPRVRSAGIWRTIFGTLELFVCEP